jgi:hypothetical protein
MAQRALLSRIGKDVSLKEALTVLDVARVVASKKTIVELALKVWVTPLQADVNVEDLLDYLGVRVVEPIKRGLVSSVLDSEDDRAVFPVKQHPGARSKVNVFFRHVWKDAKIYHKEAASYLSRNPGYLMGLYNDQASAWLMWFCAVWAHSPGVAVAIISKVREDEWLKDFSDKVKALGCNATVLGRCCTELKSMRCRGATHLDRDADVRGRIEQEFFRKEKSSGIKEEIRPYVRQVVREELAVQPSWSSPDEYWSRRWLYTKAGSHARRIEEIKLGGRLDLPPQPTRKEFMEVVDENLIAFGEPATHAGQSEKLENGATRAIYSGDTVSYTTFDYLLRPVETVWANKNCLLNPGARAQSELYPALSTRTGVNVMLDFTDYNSQHTHEAMAVVIEEACAGAPKEVLDWAVKSISNEHVYWSDNDGVRREAKTVGGLFSGHRATTFINTILNSAYTRYLYGEIKLPFEAYHAGDDIYANATVEQADRLVTRALESGVRFNPSKQGVGMRVGEFLRVAFTREEAGGYLARAITSLVSGNWATEADMSAGERAANYANQVWTLRVRSSVDDLGLLLRSTVEFRLPELAQYSLELCTNKASVNGSPVVDFVGQNLFALVVKERSVHKANTHGVPSKATDEFISRHIPRKVLDEAGMSIASLRRLMLEVSYKWRPEGDEMPTQTDVLALQVPVRDYLPYTSLLGRGIREVTVSESLAARTLARLVPGRDWEKMISVIFGDKKDLLAEVDPMAWPVTNDSSLGVAELGRIRRSVAHPICASTAYPIRV